MASRSRRVKIGIILVVVLYTIYLFVVSFSLPRANHRTEFNSSKLQLQRELEQNSDWSKLGLNFQPSKISQLPTDSTVRQQLSYQFPYQPEKPFPKNIWQTWKIPLEDPKFPHDYRSYQGTWDTDNPDYKHYIIADNVCEELIQQLYSTIPDVAKAYRIMPKSILKADFFRYLILYARGGVYSDIDTVSLKPIDTWASLQDTYNEKPLNAGLVVGIEADPDRPDWADWYARRIQFCQWTIQAKRGHPMLRELIAKITDITLTRDRKGQLKKILGKDQGGDIMNWTGPAIFTDSIFEYLNNILGSAYDNTNNAKNKNSKSQIVDWKLFTGMQSPIAIDDVLILPITSFSPDVDQMGAQSHEHPMAYAKHMFSGSWKKDSANKPEK
ncbi:membrane-bound alpha-1,6 mannosyltransferase initiation-specific [Scheffersomyces coipomensis]|uniref:membrane-bound alpha-1,6 mannosyltransferase initiation-specific n=1 Tax=Scheffersomyces coipomensis TaxID=1788519 RepID=UPI00315D748C